MVDKIAKKILEMEKNKLMSEQESNRDWKLITALDVAINMNFIKTDEARCSCCGKLMKPNEGTIIAGRCRTYILCSDCDKRKDEFIKWSDEEDD